MTPEDEKVDFVEVVANAATNQTDSVYLKMFYQKLGLPAGSTLIDAIDIAKERGYDNVEGLYKFLISNPE